jgi:3-dehydrotetronate 4-kinase
VTGQPGLLLGAIADDLTGANDLASALARNGLRAALSPGLPQEPPDGHAEALIVALKIRSVGQTEATAAATAAAEYLQHHGAQRLYFKYSSTFDSAETGNIGPVSDMLLEHTGSDLAVVCPAFPRLHRTVYQGHLFVGAHLLDRSGLGDHPLTPRREASVIFLMARQTPHGVGLVPLQTIRLGAAAIVDALSQLRDHGLRYAVTDATDDSDLLNLAAACISHQLLTGSAGLAGALASLLRPLGRSREAPDWRPPGSGPPVILSGTLLGSHQGADRCLCATRPGAAPRPRTPLGRYRQTGRAMGQTAARQIGRAYLLGPS